MSFGFGGTASHCFGGGLTGHSLSHAWSMGMDSIERTAKEEQDDSNDSSVKEEMQEQEDKLQAVPIKVQKYFSFKQYYPGHPENGKWVTIKLASVQHIEEIDDLFRIQLIGTTYFMVNEKTAKELNDILYSL